MTTASAQHRKVFISYSWSGTDHEQFVIELATALRNHGVDAILDKWHLQPGQDKHVFMESMVTDDTVSKVLVLCDARYKAKADQRTGGVGEESQIISQELYRKVAQTKFIPVLCERDAEGNECLPVFLAGRIYVDLSSDEVYGEGVDKLLRLIYDAPLHEIPALGDAPEFTKPDAGMPRAREFSSALRAVERAQPNWRGLAGLFVRSVVAEVVKLYTEPEGDAFDDAIFESIAKTKALRDQVSDFFDTLCSFAENDSAAHDPIVGLLDGLAAHFGPPERDGWANLTWQDHYLFFAREVLLIAVAAAIRNRAWKLLRRVLDQRYVVRGADRTQRTDSFMAFDAEMSSLNEHRNRRLALRRRSFVADFLKERSSLDKSPFIELQQADVFLALRSLVQEPMPGNTEWIAFWFPRTAVYSVQAPLPIFLRAENSDIKNGILHALDITDGATLRQRLKAKEAAVVHIQQATGWALQPFNFARVVNLETLCQ